MKAAFHLNGPSPLFTNSFLLIGDNGSAVIIDPAAQTQQYVKVLEDNSAQLAAIFCTHGHYDHVGSAEELKKLYPQAVLYCEPADTTGTHTFPLKAADRGYEEDGIITVDDMQFRVWHTPGHSKGSVCLLCGNFFFTGDTLFAGDTGRTDLEGGSPVEMEQSIRKLMTLPVPETAQVLPGHEDFSTYGYEMKHNYYIRMMLG